MSSVDELVPVVTKSVKTSNKQYVFTEIAQAPRVLNEVIKVLNKQNAAGSVKREAAHMALLELASNIDPFLHSSLLRLKNEGVTDELINLLVETSNGVDDKQLEVATRNCIITAFSWIRGKFNCKCK